MGDTKELGVQDLLAKALGLSPTELARELDQRGLLELVSSAQEIPSFTSTVEQRILEKTRHLIQTVTKKDKTFLKRIEDFYLRAISSDREFETCMLEYEASDRFERLGRVLTGVSRILEDVLPYEERLRSKQPGSCELIVNWAKGEGSASWGHTCEHIPAINLKDAIYNAAEYESGFDKRMLPKIAKHLLIQLKEGQLMLPNFRTLKSSAEMTLLGWLPPQPILQEVAKVGGSDIGTMGSIASSSVAIDQLLSEDEELDLATHCPAIAALYEDSVFELMIAQAVEHRVEMEPSGRKSFVYGKQAEVAGVFKRDDVQVVTGITANEALEAASRIQNISKAKLARYLKPISLSLASAAARDEDVELFLYRTETVRAIKLAESETERGGFRSFV